MSDAVLPTYVMSIDPGLDETAIAVFRLDPRVDWLRADIVQKCRAILRVDIIRTKPAWAMPKRLEHLARELRTEISLVSPTRLFLEIPAVKGSYHRVKSGEAKYQSGGVESFHQALGVITLIGVEMLGVDALVCRKASNKKKAERQSILRIALERANKTKEAAYGSDRLDAIFCGVAEQWSFAPAPRAPLSQLR